MPLVILAGVVLIHIAAVLYTLFIIKETRYKRAAHGVRRLITAAVIFDISATSCMMIGTAKVYFTVHGALGYTALAIMITDALLIWRHYRRHGHEVPFSKALHNVSRYGYLIWVLAFVTGEIIAVANMQGGQ